MNRIAKHFLVMLLWQVVSYCLLCLAPLLLAAFLWPKDGGSDHVGTAPAVISVWSLGALWLLGYSFERMLQSADGEDRAAVPTTGWASLKLPRKFGRMVPWTLSAEGIAIVVVGITFVLSHDYATVLTAMTIFWVLAVGVLWWLWATRELRFLPDPLPPAVELYLIDTDLAPEGGEHAKKIEVEDDGAVSHFVRDIVRAEILPSLSSGEREWVLGLDGKPVAIITQSPTGPEQWSEPEWLTDPDSPFKFERVHVLFVPRAARTR